MLAKEEKIFYYSYGRYFSNGFLVIFTIFALFGLLEFFATVHFSFWAALPGLLIFLGGLLSYFPIELLQVDYENKQYRVGYKFFSKIQNSEWKSLKAVKYLSIVVKKQSILIHRYLRDSDFVEDYQLRFFVKAGYYAEIDTFHKKSSAIYIGNLIAQGLDLQLLDATIQPPEFVGEEN
jgi:hypothetical protein